MTKKRAQGKPSLDLYEKFFQYSLDLYCIGNFEGTLQYVNPAWTTTLGYTPEELFSKPILEFVHPEDRAKTTQEMDRLCHGIQSVSFENRYVHKDGSIRRLCWKAVPNCESELIFANAYDSTADKLAREKLTTTEGQLREALAHEIHAKDEAEAKTKLIGDIFSQAPCLAAVSAGPDHVFKYANEAYRQFMGNRELIGKPVREAIPELDPAVLSILDKVYQSGERFMAKDIRMTGDWLADGKISEKFFTLVYAPIMDLNHKPTGLWTLAFDITEQKRLENLVQITERVTAIGRMAAGVAHEINNPLAYIFGGLTVLRKKLLSPEVIPRESLQQEVLRFVDKSENAALRIRDIVWSLNRLATDTKDTTDIVDLKSVVKTALEYVKNETSYKALVVVDLKENLKVRANEGGLIQVLLNLLINSSHAITKGSIEENEIRISAQKEPDEKISIKVKDTGQGIPKENLDRIFDPFFTSKAVGVGSGLGLSISHEIVKSFGGTITVSSTLNQGTEFTILLPAA